MSDGWMLRSRCSVRNICARDLYVPGARKDAEVIYVPCDWLLEIKQLYVDLHYDFMKFENDTFVRFLY